MNNASLQNFKRFQGAGPLATDSDKFLLVKSEFTNQKIVNWL